MTTCYRTKHVTRYTYDDPVSQCQTEVRLRPRANGRQTLQTWELHIDPEPVSLNQRTDYFGNEVHCFSILEPHDRLTITATSQLDLTAPADLLPSVTPPWDNVRDQLAAPGHPELLAASEFRWESPFVPWLAGLRAYAKPIFLPGRPLVEAAEELSHRIYNEFDYAPKATSIETPLAEVFRQRQGVCQDFAHLMIGTLRTLGLAARYVSGYLKSGTQYTGAEASHAWVSVFVPGTGWVDFDPTNDVIPSNGHVTLAWGRDYADVSPVKGVTIGGGEQAVEVEVRVVPV